MISLLPLGVKYGTLVGPNVSEVIKAGPALILQELGNLASVLIAMPLAILLGMRREAVGACSSISREPSLGVIGEKYGINSPEGTGVLGTYIVGSVLGTVFFGIISPVGLTFGLHPSVPSCRMWTWFRQHDGSRISFFIKCCTRDVWSDPRLCGHE